MMAFSCFHICRVIFYRRKTKHRVSSFNGAERTERDSFGLPLASAVRRPPTHTINISECNLTVTAILLRECLATVTVKFAFIP